MAGLNPFRVEGTEHSTQLANAFSNAVLNPLIVEVVKLLTQLANAFFLNGGFESLYSGGLETLHPAG